jgi:hypothetical protein
MDLLNNHLRPSALRVDRDLSSVRLNGPCAS